MICKLQDWTLHSFPFAYAAFDIISSDGNPHAIQLYTDISASKCLLPILRTCFHSHLIFKSEFVSSDPSNEVVWNTSFTAKSIYHTAEQKLKTLRTLSETNDMSDDASVMFAYSVVISAWIPMVIFLI